MREKLPFEGGMNIRSGQSMAPVGEGNNSFLFGRYMTGGVHVHGELPQLSLGYQTFFEKCTHFFVMKSNTKVKQRTNPGIFEEEYFS